MRLPWKRVWRIIESLKSWYNLTELFLFKILSGLQEATLYITIQLNQNMLKKIK